MSALVLLGVALAGGIGAGLRFVLDGLVRERVGLDYPVGTVLINLAGSFLLGLVSALAGRAVLGPDLALVLGTGACGGFTTFSTASLETVRLAVEGRRGAAWLHGLGMLLAAVLAAGAGLWLATVSA